MSDKLTDAEKLFQSELLPSLEVDDVIETDWDARSPYCAPYQLSLAEHVTARSALESCSIMA